MELSGALDAYESSDITPVIGREFPKANLVDWMNDPKANELLRDLAITSGLPFPPLTSRLVQQLTFTGKFPSEV